MQVYFGFSFGFHPTQEFFKVYLVFQKEKKKEEKKGKKKEGRLSFKLVLCSPN